MAFSFSLFPARSPIDQGQIQSANTFEQKNEEDTQAQFVINPNSTKEAILKDIEEQEGYKINHDDKTFYFDREFHKYSTLFSKGIIFKNINYTTLSLDAVIAVVANSHEGFDRFIQVKKALSFLVPAYLAPVLLIPIWKTCSNRKRIHAAQGKDWQNLPMTDIECVETFDALENEDENTILRNLKMKRKTIEYQGKAQFFTHTLTFMFNVAFHAVYACMIKNNEEENQNHDFFVENYDWLAPAVIFSIMEVLSYLMNEFFARKKRYDDQQRPSFFNAKGNQEYGTFPKNAVEKKQKKFGCSIL